MQQLLLHIPALSSLRQPVLVDNFFPLKLTKHREKIDPASEKSVSQYCWMGSTKYGSFRSFQMLPNMVTSFCCFFD
jgi:hypothetical protein